MQTLSLAGRTLLSIAVLLLAACGGGGTTVAPGQSVTITQTPSPITIKSGESFTLSGSASSVKNRISSMGWSAVASAGDAPRLTLTNATCASAQKQDNVGGAGLDSSQWSCTTASAAPLVPVATTYQVTLNVADAAGNTASSTALVTVNPPPAGSAAGSAGALSAATTPQVNVSAASKAALTCAGSGGYMASPLGLTYQWVLLSNPNALDFALTSADTSTVHVDVPALPPGLSSASAVFQCRVTDSALNTSTASTRVTVSAVPLATSSASVVADAGNAQLVNAGSVVTLDGTASHTVGASGTPALYYEWTQVAPPTNASLPAVSLSSAHSAKASFLAPAVTGQTALRFRLVASLAPIVAGYVPALTEVAEVDVYVNTSGTTNAPIAVANAGAAQTVAINSTVTLDGSKSAAVGGSGSLFYRWTQESPATPVLALSSASTERASFLAPSVSVGTLFRFKLTAGLVPITSSYMPGSTEVSYVDVYVLGTTTPQLVLPPVQTTTAGTATVMVAGLQNHAGTEPTFYRWTQISGPLVILQNPNAASASFFAPSVAQATALLFRVQASFDPNFPVGATASADCQVRVTP